MSNLRYIAETPKTRGETFVFHMPLEEFCVISRERLNWSLEGAAKVEVRKNSSRKVGHVFVEILDFEVRQDENRNIAVIAVIYNYIATMVSTIDKTVWNKHKLLYPDLRFYTRER